MVDAHTLCETNQSTRVLEKISMKKIGTAHDPEEGEVWHWRVNREDYFSVADAGVDIEVIYSDHNHQLIPVVDDLAKGRKVSESWMREHRL
jgi:hypothetical protein